MQVKIKQNDFILLGLKNQIKFVCSFFSNFIDKIYSLYYFNDIIPKVKINQEFNKIQTK